jgi:predicted transcriptional regulator
MNHRPDENVVQKRSRLETIHLILELALKGILKTHIMYRANLSHQQLNKYMNLLLEHQLLQRQQKLYVTTETGRAFIHTFHEIQAIMGERPMTPEPTAV